MKPVLPDFVGGLASERVVAPALVHIFVLYRDTEEAPKVISSVCTLVSSDASLKMCRCGNTFEGGQFALLWAQHEVGQSENEWCASWLA